MQREQSVALCRTHYPDGWHVRRTRAILVGGLSLLLLAVQSTHANAQGIPAPAARAVPVLVRAGKWIADAVGQYLVSRTLDRATGAAVESELERAYDDLRRHSAADSATNALLHSQIALTESYLGTMRLLLGRVPPTAPQVLRVQQRAENDRDRLLDMLTEVARQYGQRIDRMESAHDSLRERVIRSAASADSLAHSIRAIADSTEPKSEYISELEDRLRARIIEDSIDAIDNPPITDSSKSPLTRLISPTASTVAFMYQLSPAGVGSGNESVLISADYAINGALSRSLGMIAFGASYIGGVAGITARIPASGYNPSAPLWSQLVFAFIQVGGTVGHRSAPETPEARVSRASGFTAGAIGAAGIGVGAGVASMRAGVAATVLSRGSIAPVYSAYASVTIGW